MLNHRQKVCIYDRREMKEVRTASIEQIVKSVIAEWYSTCAVCLILFCNLECIGNVRCPFICPCHAPMIIIVSSQWTIKVWSPVRPVRREVYSVDISGGLPTLDSPYLMWLVTKGSGTLADGLFIGFPSTNHRDTQWMV